MTVSKCIFAGALTCVMASATATAAQSPDLPPCSTTRWIVNSGSLRASQAEFPLDLQRQQFDSPCTFLVIPRNAPAGYDGWRAVRTRSAPSLEGIRQAAADDAVSALLYDDEAWEMTPSEEQHDPAAAACQAASIAHAHGKILIATPAIDLMRVLDPGAARGGHRFEAFEQTRLATRIAQCADVYEIQAQGAERDTGKFRQFVETEAKQARAGNLHIIVLAGISTNPIGQHVTAEELLKAVQSVRGVVDGFWLNIPSGGKYCPTCGTPQPQVAVELLRKMESAGQ